MSNSMDGWVPLEPACGMSKGQREIIEEENKYREMFYSDRTNKLLDDPHLNMINPFDPKMGKTFIFEEEDEEEKKVPKILTSQRRSPALNGKPSLVTDRATFEANWAKFTGGILDGLNWENVFAAGGSVLSCLTPGGTSPSQAGAPNSNSNGNNGNSEDPYAASDIDLFFYGLADDAAANAKLREVYDVILANTRAMRAAEQKRKEAEKEEEEKQRKKKEEEEKAKGGQPSWRQRQAAWLETLAQRRAAERAAAARADDAKYGALEGECAEVLAVRSKRAVSFVGGYPARNVQVIVRVYKSPAEVLLGFDVDSCAVGYDGRDVWATRRFRNAQNKGYNLVNPTRRSTTYEVRLRKYARRGYAVAVPGLDKARADPALFSRSGARLLLRAQGLARLLVYEFYDVHSEYRPRVTYSPTLHRMLVSAAALGDAADASNSNSGYFYYYSSSSSRTRRFGFNPEDSADSTVAEYAAAEADNPSDYSEVFIPWGPAWSVRSTRRMLNVRDRSQLFGSAAIRRRRRRRRKQEEMEENNNDNEESDGSDDDDEENEDDNDNDDNNDDDENWKVTHTHCLVTGIDGVISGNANAYWCRLCREHVPVEAAGEDSGISGPIQWERGCPCYQDYEHGVLRKMIVGSFSSLTEPYDKGAYTDEPFPADRPHPLQRRKEAAATTQGQGQGQGLFAKPLFGLTFNI